MSGVLRLILVAAIVLLAVTSCEEPPAPPRRGGLAAPRGATAPVDRRPELKSMLEATWKRLRLPESPLTIEVPPQWNLVRGSEGYYLRGPAPHGPLPDGHVVVALARLSLTRERARWLKMAEEPTAESACPQVRLHEARELPQTWLADRRIVELSAFGGEPRMNWTVRAYVDEGPDTVIMYGLYFIDMSADQYDKDLELLDRIIRSLRYDPISTNEARTTNEPATGR